MSNNPSLLTLLKAGCKVTFPSGYILEGLPDTDYIQLAYNIDGDDYADGLRGLDKEGVRLSLIDERKYSQLHNDAEEEDRKAEPLRRIN